MSAWICHKVVLRRKLESEIWQRLFEICKLGELLDHRVVLPSIIHLVQVIGQHPLG